ncbi:hypothetical protein Tco_0053371 [Tanacetum coccineum]
MVANKLVLPGKVGVARQVDLQVEVERERQREEEASKAAIAKTKLRFVERQKRVIDDFKTIDSDDAVKYSKEAAGVHKQKVLEEPNSTKVEVKQEGH